MTIMAKSLWHDTDGNDKHDDHSMTTMTNDKDDENEKKGLTEIRFLQNIFDSYLDGHCPHYSSKEGSEGCQQCQKSANPKCEDKPCWYGTSQSTGKILKKYVVEGCLKESKDKDIGDKRSFFISDALQCCPWMLRIFCSY